MLSEKQKKKNKNILLFTGAQYFYESYLENYLDKEDIQKIAEEFVFNEDVFSNPKYIKVLLDSTFEHNPLELIDFIKENKHKFKDYNTFWQTLYKYMMDNCNKEYVDFLRVYLDYIKDPFTHESEEEILRQKYEELKGQKFLKTQKTSEIE